MHKQKYTKQQTTVILTLMHYTKGIQKKKSVDLFKSVSLKFSKTVYAEDSQLSLNNFMKFMIFTILFSIYFI